MIVPAVIPTSLEHLKLTLGQLNFTHKVQIDVVDGLYVPSTSWPYSTNANPEEASDLLTDLEVEVDLMVQTLFPS